MSSDPRWGDDARDHSRHSVERESVERDPRDSFMRHVDLPRGPEREIVHERDREYTLRGSETLTLATVGAFRVVPTGQLRDHENAAARDRSADVWHLREQGLIETVRVPGHRGSVAVLTKEGRDLLERHRVDQAGASQTFYAGLKRTRELEHDAQIFAAYLEAAERFYERGARVDRVVLDYELKRDYQKWLHEHDGDRDDYTRRIDARRRPDSDQYAGKLLHDRIIGALELCCRRGEMLLIQNKRVNWDTCQIGIPGATAKDKENRRIPFNPKGRLAAILKRRRDLGPDAYVFGSASGEYQPTLQTGWETLKLLANDHTLKAGAEGIKENQKHLRQIDLRWHDLRHEGACRLLADGVDIRIIQLMLGHASIQQTQRYLNVTDEELRRGLEVSWRNQGRPLRLASGS